MVGQAAPARRDLQSCEGPVAQPEDPELTMARRHLAEGEARIGAQRRMIDRLEDLGQPTDLAEQLLACLEGTMTQMQAHYAYLLRTRE